MTKICGVVAEYNPFHLGHGALLETLRLRGATHIAVAMSGDFVQRGEPALLSKWERARMALSCGADLIVELPAPWAVSGAERFAFGGVALLSALGCDALGFGSEHGDSCELQRLADALLSPFLCEKLAESGRSIGFAAARQAAVAKLCGEETAALLSTPNNTLGVEYLKALRVLGVSMQVETMARVGAAHGGAECGGIASAGEIRRLVALGKPWKHLLPAPCAQLLRSAMNAGEAPGRVELLERAMLARLRQMTKEQFAALPEISGGLESRLFSASRTAKDLEEFYALAKTKCYSHARIRRAALCAFLGIAERGRAEAPPYLRVLGMNPRGAEILARANSLARLPIIGSFADMAELPEQSRSLFSLEDRCCDLYALALPKPYACGLNRTHGIIKVKN